jgi:hypothetical protein
MIYDTLKYVAYRLCGNLDKVPVVQHADELGSCTVELLLDDMWASQPLWYVLTVLKLAVD